MTTTLAPTATVTHTMEDLASLFTERDLGGRVKIDEGVFDYFLEVLPPIYMGQQVMIDEVMIYVDFGFAEGAEEVVAFWQEGGDFYCQNTGQMNPYA